MTNSKAQDIFKTFAGRTVGILWEDPYDDDLGHYTRGPLVGLRVRPGTNCLVLAFEVQDTRVGKEYLSQLIDVRSVGSVVRAD